MITKRYVEIEEREQVSDCCLDMVLTDAHGQDICIECKEICGRTYEPCIEGICDGSGEIANLFYDDTVKLYMTDGTKPCLCTF